MGVVVVAGEGVRRGGAGGCMLEGLRVAFSWWVWSLACMVA